MVMHELNNLIISRKYNKINDNFVIIYTLDDYKNITHTDIEYIVNKTREDHIHTEVDIPNKILTFYIPIKLQICHFNQN